jgi:hypothetical protein
MLALRAKQNLHSNAFHDRKLSRSDSEASCIISETFPSCSGCHHFTPHSRNRRTDEDTLKARRRRCSLLIIFRHLLTVQLKRVSNAQRPSVALKFGPFESTLTTTKYWLAVHITMVSSGTMLCYCLCLQLSGEASTSQSLVLTSLRGPSTDLSRNHFLTSHDGNINSNYWPPSSIVFMRSFRRTKNQVVSIDDMATTSRDRQTAYETRYLGP